MLLVHENFLHYKDSGLGIRGISFWSFFNGFWCNVYKNEEITQQMTASKEK